MAPIDQPTKLLLLGTIEVRGQARDAEPLARIQPKRTALLAYLALAGGPARRDILRAMLWPELDDAQARRALNQAVFHLRRSLGDESIESSGMESISLDRARVACDAVEFEERCRSGDWEAAMALYRGPFLAGFHVGELEELERWIESVRARLSAAAFDACSKLAADRSKHDPRTALAWARRAYEIEPGDAAIRRVIGLHDALGDRAGAVRAYEEFARRIEEELGVEPSPETRRLAEDVRARATPADGWPATPVEDASASTAVPGPTAPGATDADAIDAAAAEVGAAAGRESSDTPSTSLRPMRTMAMGFSGVVGVVIVTAIIALAMTRRAGQVDAAALTNSKEALAAYQLGDRELAAGRFESAVENFRRAVATDSSYAMAHYRLSVAANWTGQSVLANSAAAHAEQLTSSLTGRDRLRIEAWVNYLRGETAKAQQLYAKVLSTAPNDFDAAFYLAEIQFHWGPSFGLPTAATAPAWDHVLELQPANAGAIIHRLRIAAMERDRTTFESLATRLNGLHPSVDHLIEVRTLRAFTFGDSADRAAATEEIASIDALRRSLVHEALLSARDLDGAAKRLVPTLFVNQGFESFDQGEFLLGAQASAATGHIAAALARIDSAVPLQADRALEYRAMIASIPGAALPSGLRSSVRRALDGPLSSQRPYNTAQLRRDYLGAILAVRDGDLLTARRKLELLQSRSPRPVRDYDTTLARHVDQLSRIAGAEIARAQRKPDSALAMLGNPMPEPDRRIPYVWSYPRAEERMLRGELLAETGHLKEALAWFSTFPDPGTYDLAYLPWALARRAKIADAIGDHRSANAARARSAMLAGESVSQRARQPSVKP